MVKRVYATLVAAAAMTALFSGAASAQLLAPENFALNKLNTNNSFDIDANKNTPCYYASSLGSCITETDSVSNPSSSNTMALRTNETMAGAIYFLNAAGNTLSFYMKNVGANTTGTLMLYFTTTVLTAASSGQDVLNALNGPKTLVTFTATGADAGGGWKEYQTASFGGGASQGSLLFNAVGCQGQQSTCLRIDELRVPGPVPGAGLLSLAALGAAVGYSRFRRRREAQA